MDACKQIILWLAFICACFLPASALTPTAPENRVWEIFSTGYDAAVTEATDLGNLTETPTSNYDAAPIHRVSAETKPTAAERPLFGSNAEFKAAEGTLTAAERGEIQDIADFYQTDIDVVGSRAAGEGRGLGTDLPVGKGPGTRSDIDFRIDADHPLVDDLIGALKTVGNGAGRASVKYSTSDRATLPPFIRFTPSQ